MWIFYFRRFQNFHKLGIILNKKFCSSIFQKFLFFITSENLQWMVKFIKMTGAHISVKLELVKSMKSVIFKKNIKMFDIFYFNYILSFCLQVIKLAY